MYIPTPGFVDNGQVPSPLRMYPGGGGATIFEQFLKSNQIK